MRSLKETDWEWNTDEELDDYEWMADPEEDAELLQEFDDFGKDVSTNPPLDDDLEDEEEEDEEDLDGDQE
jgi:hypothetical protein